MSAENSFHPPRRNTHLLGAVMPMHTGTGGRRPVSSSPVNAAQAYSQSAGSPHSEGSSIWGWNGGIGMGGRSLPLLLQNLIDGEMKIDTKGVG